MSLKIGNLGSQALSGASSVSLSASTIASNFEDSLVVGNFAENMKVTFTVAGDESAYTTVHTATAYDDGTKSLTITPALTYTLPVSSAVNKVYEGSHGTQNEHSRKRLLGYL